MEGAALHRPRTVELFNGAVVELQVGNALQMQPEHLHDFFDSLSSNTLVERMHRNPRKDDLALWERALTQEDPNQIIVTASGAHPNRDDSMRLVGLAEARPDNTQVNERLLDVAIVVVDDMKGMSLGRQLLSALVAKAREVAGASRAGDDPPFEGLIAYVNQASRGIFEGHGFQWRHPTSNPQDAYMVLPFNQLRSRI